MCIRSRRCVTQKNDCFNLVQNLHGNHADTQKEDSVKMCTLEQSQTQNKAQAANHCALFLV